MLRQNRNTEVQLAFVGRHNKLQHFFSVSQFHIQTQEGAINLLDALQVWLSVPWLSWETPPRSKCNAETNFCPLPSVTGDHCSCFLDEAENESLFQVLTAYPGTVGLFLSGPADLYWSNSDGVRLDFWDGFWFCILYLHEKFFSLRKILFVKFSKSGQARDALLQLLPGKKKKKKVMAMDRLDRYEHASLKFHYLSF